MPNITRTENTLGSVILRDAQFQEGLITFAGASTLLAGTILAIKTSTKKYVPLALEVSTDGLNVPRAVLTYDVTSAGSGDVPARIGVAGTYRQELLFPEVTSTNKNDIVQGLQNCGIIVVDVSELNIFDN